MDHEKNSCARKYANSLRSRIDALHMDRANYLKAGKVVRETCCRLLAFHGGASASGLWNGPGDVDPASNDSWRFGTDIVGESATDLARSLTASTSRAGVSSPVGGWVDVSSPGGRRRGALALL